MKYKFLIMITVLFTMIYLNACKDNPTQDDNDPPPATGNYFPNAEGNYYKYSIERTDSTGTNNTGTRSTTYQGTTTIAGTMYQNQRDSFFIAGQTVTNISYFRRTQGTGTQETGVFYFLDTTGLSQSLPAGFPDSLLQYIDIDAEMRTLSFPFTDGKTWPVFKVDLTFGIFNINLVDVTAFYEGMEAINLNLASGTVNREAAKIRYELKLTIPNPSNPFQTTTSIFRAWSWVVSDIGVARWQGSGAIIGALAGGGIDIEDSTRVVSQNLIQYDLK